MQLRYLITTTAITADELRKFRIDNYMSFDEAKRVMENRTEPVLQYVDKDGEWIDVPTVVEYREK